MLDCTDFSYGSEAMPVRHYWNACLCAAWVLVFSACSTGPDIDDTIHESPQGLVYLTRISDRSFQAAHPIKIDPTTIALVLSGVLVREDQSAVQNFFTGAPDAHRAFSEGEVAYLAPLISEGLRRAASDQQVGFRIAQIGLPRHAHNTGGGVGSSEPPLELRPKETTSGVIHAYGQSLYLTITEYRVRTESANTINMANRRLPDSSGLINHTVLFLPEAAQRPDSYLDARSTDKTLVIDYQLLAKLPPPSSTPAAQPAPTPAAPQAATGGKAEPAGKDADIEALRKELQEIKKQLAEQEAERARSQPKNTVPEK
jgi:hypothetical protein